MIDYLQLAKDGYSFESHGRNNALTANEWNVIVSRTAGSEAEGTDDYYTDYLFSSDVDGEVRLTMDGGEVCAVFYEAKAKCNCGRTTPLPVPDGSVLKIEFKPISTGKASANFGGVQI